MTAALPLAEQLTEWIEMFEDDVIFNSRRRDYALSVQADLEAWYVSLIGKATKAEREACRPALNKIAKLRRRAYKLLYTEYGIQPPPFAD